MARSSRRALVWGIYPVRRTTTPHRPTRTPQARTSTTRFTSPKVTYPTTRPMPPPPAIAAEIVKKVFFVFPNLFHFNENGFVHVVNLVIGLCIHA